MTSNSDNEEVKEEKEGEEITESEESDDDQIPDYTNLSINKLLNDNLLDRAYGPTGSKSNLELGNKQLEVKNKKIILSIISYFS